MEAFGIEVVLVLEPLAPDPIGKIWREAINETMAYAESVKISPNTLTGMKAPCTFRDPESGWAYKCGGQAPFGYKSVKVVRGTNKKKRTENMPTLGP